MGGRANRSEITFYGRCFTFRSRCYIRLVVAAFAPDEFCKQMRFQISVLASTSLKNLSTHTIPELFIFLNTA